MPIISKETAQRHLDMCWKRKLLSRQGKATKLNR